MRDDENDEQVVTPNTTQSLIMPRAVIVLLKEPSNHVVIDQTDCNLSNAEEKDPYQLVLEAADCDTRWLSPLNFKFTHQSELQCCLMYDSWLSIVCTSPRGVQALCQSLDDLQINQAMLYESNPWARLTLWVPGLGSALCWTRSQHSHLFPVRTEGGNADRLAIAIINAYPELATASHTSNCTNENSTSSQSRFLVLSGNLRRAELSARFQENAILFKELQVYDTEVDPNLLHNYCQLVETLSVELATPPRPPLWLVFFSPSGANALQRALAGFEQPDKAGLQEFRIAVIGSTTATAISELSWRLDAVAEHPNAQSLLVALGLSS